MNDEKSESSCQDEVLSANFDQTDFSVNPDVSLWKGNDSMNQQDTVIHEDKKPIEEQLTQFETISVLLNNNDQKECPSLIEDNSINSTIKNSASLSNLSENKFLQCEALINDTDLPDEKSLQKSASYNDIALSNSFSCLSSDVVSNNAPKSMISADFKEQKSASNDEEETLFSTKLQIDTDQTISSKENIIQNSVVNEKLTDSSNHRTETLKNVEYEKIYNKEEQRSIQSSRNARSQGNSIVRPTLVDDSKLVKISLPTNPINIMQSNAQFLNKSRNFLNFITEKSTNIMEKALLPQHLSVKYNSMMKSIDNSYNDKKYIEESCSTKSPPTETTNAGESCAIEKTTDISYSLKSQLDTESVRKECTMNCESKKTLITSQNENTCVNTETSDKNYDNPSDSCLSNSKQIEPYSVNDKSNTANEIATCMKANGNCDEYINSRVSDYQGNSIDSESSKQSLLKHPAYLTLLKDYADFKTKCIKLQEKVEYLEEKNRTLETESNGEIHALQVETLKKTINRLTLELHASSAAQETLKKEYSGANKERESMVMKYVVSEKQLIDTQRARECAERKAKESTKQQELLQNKLREIQGERTRICNILDGKCREVTDLQKEVEKLKEDVNMRDIKLKWTQNRLKLEMDTQKETQQKLDKATTRINEMKEECELVRKEAQESMRNFQRSEENKAVTLDQQLKEQQARLILERHVTEDKEMLILQLQKEVETLNHRQQVLIEENNTLSLKIQNAEKNRLNYESNLSNLKIISDQRQKEIVELRSKVSEFETLKIQLQHKDQCLQSMEAETKQLRSANEELQADMYACRQKEAEMLDFTQKLTDKNVRLQSEFTAIEAKVKQLEEEHGPLHEQIRRLIAKVHILEESLAKEQKTRNEDCEILARHLAEQTQLAQNFAQKLEDSQGENAVLKRKQQISTKEMTRELQQCRKKLEAFESSMPYNSLGAASRAGSNISLNTGETLNGALSDNSMNGDQHVQIMEPSRQTLIDRIIKLQEDSAKKAEKLDFFEEHCRTLVEELQKKTKIIQTYILHENSGAMGSNERDKYKAELARHGGIMASVYNQRVSDENMTLELSLEINQKLQAVLEDALFKNITLKDNIDTLGDEIARLTMQNQQRKIKN